MIIKITITKVQLIIILRVVFFLCDFCYSLLFLMFILIVAVPHPSRQIIKYNICSFITYTNCHFTWFQFEIRFKNSDLITIYNDKRANLKPKSLGIQTFITKKIPQKYNTKKLLHNHSTAYKITNKMWRIENQLLFVMNKMKTKCFCSVHKLTSIRVVK